MFWQTCLSTQTQLSLCGFQRVFLNSWCVGIFVQLRSVFSISIYWMVCGVTCCFEPCKHFHGRQLGVSILSCPTCFQASGAWLIVCFLPWIYLFSGGENKGLDSRTGFHLICKLCDQYGFFPLVVLQDFSKLLVFSGAKKMQGRFQECKDLVLLLWKLSLLWCALIWL